ncbi:PREDICTED: uncharacterized protein LOC107190903 [Dufourea novaeangliae]|uniref:uncharacterized protein LOC107190903 n=1 Tax=Dufourea novaeangliae TaxID=178035 RepID=UPI00076768FB|nr:PREDICTED: uncharacterized protein LOC107190903 [Dufourea novaeangliae]
MANTSTLSLPRIEKSISTYAPKNTATVRGLSNDFDDIIERIENLRFARIDREESSEKQALTSLSDDTEDKEDGRDDNGRGPNGIGSDAAEHHDDRLIERGPIKSQFLSDSRDRPYWTTNGPIYSSKTNETFVLDCEETAEQILRDEECREKLNACLDRLQDTVRTVSNRWNLGENRNSLEIHAVDADTDFLFSQTSATNNDPSEDALLEILSRNAFQPAQYLLCGNNLVTTQGIPTTHHDSVIDTTPDGSTSSFKNRDFGSTRSSGSSSRMRLPRTNSPISSPGLVNSRVTATAYRPQQLSSSTSNSSCSPSSLSSSSSNQSYGDAQSPIGSQSIFVSRIEERLGEDLGNFSFWINNPETVESTDASDVVDTIDNNELQLVEEVLRDLGEEKSKVEEARHRRSFKSEKLTTSICSPHVNTVKPIVYQDSEISSTTRHDMCKPEPRIPPTQRPNSSATARNQKYQNPDTSVVNSSKKNGSSGVSIERHQSTPDLSFLLHPFVSSSSTLDPIVSGVDGVAQFPFLEAHPNERYDEFRPAKVTDTRDDIRIPKMVACFESANCRVQRHSERNIMPWPSLNLPSVRASERLTEDLNPKEVERAMSSLLKLSLEELAKQDDDGDTMLMCLVANPDELAKKRAYLAPLVERLSTVRGALSAINNRGEDALYLAALNCPQYSYVTGYLAATMIQKGIDVSQRLYHTRGDTLIHLVAAQGDSHVDNIAELLALKTIQGNRVFDLSKRNYDGKTALHVAIELHDPSVKKIVSVATVRLLLECGADPRVKETKCGYNALHMAISLSCDPALVKVLLDAYAVDLVNTTNYNHDTALHVAAAVSDNVPLERQKEVFWLLIQAGGHTNLSNRRGKTPLALVSPERKNTIKRIVYKRS